MSNVLNAILFLFGATLIVASAADAQTTEYVLDNALYLVSGCLMVAAAIVWKLGMR